MAIKNQIKWNHRVHDGLSILLLLFCKCLTQLVIWWYRFYNRLISIRNISRQKKTIIIIYMAQPHNIRMHNVFIRFCFFVQVRDFLRMSMDMNAERGCVEYFHTTINPVRDGTCWHSTWFVPSVTFWVCKKFSALFFLFVPIQWLLRMKCVCLSPKCPKNKTEKFPFLFLLRFCKNFIIAGWFDYIDGILKIKIIVLYSVTFCLRIDEPKMKTK